MIETKLKAIDFSQESRKLILKRMLHSLRDWIDFFSEHNKYAFGADAEIVSDFIHELDLMEHNMHLIEQQNSINLVGLNANSKYWQAQVALTKAKDFATHIQQEGRGSSANTTICLKHLSECFDVLSAL